MSEETAIKILKSRMRYIDAVVITGGEPTIYPDLPNFIKRLKDEGFSVKLDTNGLSPDILLKCIPNLDYVAVDVKTSLEKYAKLGAGKAEIRNLVRTINILKEDIVDYEFRNTAVPYFVEEADVLKIGELVKGGKRFAFQQFVPGDTLDEQFRNVRPHPPEKILRFGEIMKEYVNEVIMRV